MKYKPYSENNKIFCKDTGEKCTGENYLHSKHWRDLRNKIYELRNGECDRCHSVFKLDQLVLHHRTYKRMGNEDYNDISLLCKRCHKITHKARNMQKRDNLDMMTLYRELSREEKIKACKFVQSIIDNRKGGMKEETDITDNIPSTKQIDFARAIADRLKLNLPKEYTKEAYHHFIEDNVGKFYSYSMVAPDL